MPTLPPEPPSSEITPESVYLGRREFLKNGALAAGTAALVGSGLLLLVGQKPPPSVPNSAPVAAVSPPAPVAPSAAVSPPAPVAPSAAVSPPAPSAASTNPASTSPASSNPAAAASPVLGSPGTDVAAASPAPGSPFDTDEPLTSFQSVTTYNNFYEFGLDKESPARQAGILQTRPWTISIEGEVAKPQTIDIDTLIGWFPPQERVYRMRCVEGWSMVIPWLGFPLGDLIKRLEPTGNAQYVEFVTLNDPKQMPGLKRPVLDWPYVEGLRLDEAMHPLSMLVMGLYGKVLPNQNGAPLRLVVPWKYGFKGIKSIVTIRFTTEQPKSTWALAAPSEYGFYANVNPDVSHPRWSQATERRIGDLGRRKTLPFNGYAEQVAELYAGMDPKKLY